MLLVPGNHDADRAWVGKGVRYIQNGLLAERSQEAIKEAIAELLGDDGERDMVLKRHAAYLKFYGDWLGQPQPLPWWQRTLEIRGQRLHVAGLDSAWVAMGGPQDYGRLLLGQYQVNQAVAEREAEGADWRLALVHHPLDHLAPFDGAKARATLHLHRDLILRGHLHEPQAFRVVPPDPKRACLELAAGCVYETSHHPNAFQWIELYPQSDQGPKRVQVLLRTWVNGAWQVDGNQPGCPNGTCDFRFDDLDGVRRQKTCKCVNLPLRGVPKYFQGRRNETTSIVKFISDPAQRLMIITGPAGIGKTVLVYRLLRNLEDGLLPNTHNTLEVGGIIYLSQIGSRKITAQNIYEDLRSLLPHDDAGLPVFEDAQPVIDIGARIRTLLERFQQRPVIVLLDNFEGLLDSNKRSVLDSDLDATIDALLESPIHKVKTIITTRLVPAALPEPACQCTIILTEGLTQTETNAVLRKLDTGGQSRLKSASAAVLKEIRRITQGYPKALEALHQVLITDLSMTLPAVLDKIRKGVAGADIMAALAGWQFDYFDSTTQQVIQALAIYPRPVPIAAVDSILTDVHCQPVLDRLVNQHIVQRQLESQERGGVYHLHSINQAYALSKLVEGAPIERKESARPLTRFALRYRAAEYLRKVRVPRSDWIDRSALDPLLDEFSLRYDGQEYDAAVQLLNSIDADYLRRWGYYKEVVARRQQLDGLLTERRMAAQNLANMGKLYSMIGEVKKAIPLLAKALPVLEDFAIDPDGRTECATCLDYLATAYMDHARFNEAIKLLDEAIILLKDGCNPSVIRMQSVCFGRRGAANRCLGEIEVAIRDEEEALQLAKSNDLIDRQAVECQSLGTAYRDIGQFDSAIHYYVEGVALARRVGEPRREAIGLAFLGIVYRLRGDLEKAEQHSMDALTICEGINDVRHKTICLSNLGSTAYARQQFDLALKHFHAAKQAAETIGDPRSISFANLGIGNTLIATGKPAEAISYLIPAEMINVPEVGFQIHCALGLAHAQSDNPSGARAAFEKARDQCNALLAIEPRLFEPLYSLPVTLVGLAACAPKSTSKSELSERVADAAIRYNNAITACEAKGARCRVDRDLDALRRVRSEVAVICLKEFDQLHSSPISS